MEETRVIESKTVAEAERELEEEDKRKKKERRLIILAIIGAVCIGGASAQLVFLLKGKEPEKSETAVIGWEDVKRINRAKITELREKGVKLEAKTITIEK